MAECMDCRREMGSSGRAVCRLVAKWRGGRWRCRYDGINCRSSDRVLGDLMRCFSSWVIHVMARSKPLHGMHVDVWGLRR